MRTQSCLRHSQRNSHFTQRWKRWAIGSRPLSGLVFAILSHGISQDRVLTQTRKSWVSFGNVPESRRDGTRIETRFFHSAKRVVKESFCFGRNQQLTHAWSYFLALTAPANSPSNSSVVSQLMHASVMLWP